MSDREQTDAERDALVEEARALGATKREAERAVKRQLPIEYAWRGITRYRCPLCPVDRDTAAEIEEHVAAAHPPDEPTELQRMTGAAAALEITEATTEEPADA